MIRAATFAIALIAFPQPSLAQQQAAISIELNVVEQLDGLCRFVFVNRNSTEDTVNALVMETVAFDAQGGVSRITSFDFADLPAGSTRVRQFDLPDLDCADVSALLVNGVQGCEGVSDCAARLVTTSRTDVEMLK